MSIGNKLRQNRRYQGNREQGRGNIDFSNPLGFPYIVFFELSNTIYGT